MEISNYPDTIMFELIFAIVTMTICACVKAYSNSLDTLNANSFRVL